MNYSVTIAKILLVVLIGFFFYWMMQSISIDATKERNKTKQISQCIVEEYEKDPVNDAEAYCHAKYSKSIKLYLD